MKKTASWHDDLISTEDLSPETSVPRHADLINKLSSFMVNTPFRSDLQNPTMFLRFAHASQKWKMVVKKCLSMRAHIGET